MPTTPNYAWPTPADTDYVKDGAAAIRSLGNAIDDTVATHTHPGSATPGVVQIAATLLTASAASITFAAIPQTYGDLLLVLSGSGDGASGAATNLVELIINGDTATNYERHYTEALETGAPATSRSAATAGIVVGRFPFEAALGAASRVLLHNYRRTTPSRRTVEAQWNTYKASNYYVGSGGGAWKNTAAVTDLLLRLTSGSFGSGTRAVLYGIGS